MLKGKYEYCNKVVDHSGSNYILRLLIQLDYVHLVHDQICLYTLCAKILGRSAVLFLQIISEIHFMSTKKRTRSRKREVGQEKTHASTKKRTRSRKHALDQESVHEKKELVQENTHSSKKASTKKKPA